MKKIFLLLLIFCFPAFAAENNVKILPEFLGYWKPYSHGTEKSAIEITDNGLIYDINIDTKKVYAVSFYRPIMNKKGKSYLLVHSLMVDHTGTDIWEIEFEPFSKFYDNPNIKKLTITHMGCSADADHFARFSQRKLQELLQKGLCPYGRPAEPLNRSSYSWTRKSP